MTANRFVLKHDEIEVAYTIGVSPGVPALVYRDGSASPKDFPASEVTTDKTAAGTLVSVPLRRSIDAGGERFGFFLPDLDVPDGHHEHFTTAGVYERYSGPDSLPRRWPSWQCITLHGTAQSVMVEPDKAGQP